MLGQDFMARDAVLSNLGSLRQLEPQLMLAREIIDEVGSADMFASDILALAAFVKAYRPEVILELGRGYGLSTATFRLVGGRVVSVCRTDEWNQKTVPALTLRMSLDWRSGIEAITGEICGRDYGPIVGQASRIMIFWDAHGWDVADTVLSEILPLIRGHAIVVCHDLRDSRYFPDDCPYSRESLWRGQSEPFSAFIRLGNVHSSFEQLVSIVDFTSRNNIPLVSPSDVLANNAETRNLFSHPYWPVLLWQYFEIDRATRSYTFPARRIARENNIAREDPARVPR